MDLIPTAPPPGFRQSIADTYDSVAAQRETMGEADWRWPIAQRFLDAMKREGHDTLLEIGAGVGFTSSWFAERGVSVVATDLSPAQVELCRAKGLDARVRDMYELGFDSGSFGAVWMMNCIHHVPSQDLRTVLEGIKGVLVPGGLLYLGVWGGIDSEGMPVEDFYQPPRYFCFRSDASLRSAVEEVFIVEWFETFTPGDGDPEDALWMQSLLARSR